MTDKKETLDVKFARLDEKLNFVLQELSSIKNGTITRIEDLEKTKADRIEIDAVQKKLDYDIGTRVRNLETDRVTQREHCILVDRVSSLDNGQTKVFAWAAALAFVISLAVTLLGIFIPHIIKL